MYISIHQISNSLKLKNANKIKKKTFKAIDNNTNKKLTHYEYSKIVAYNIMISNKY